MTEHKYFVFRFEDVEVREREFTVWRGGKALPVEPRAFRLLLFLLRHPQKLISKDELLGAVWSDCSVSDNSLTRSVALLRRILADDSREPRYIATVPSIGYRFLCDVQAIEEGLPAPVASDLKSGGVEAAEKTIQTLAQPALKAWTRAVLVASGGLALLILIAATAFLVHRAIREPAGHDPAAPVASSHTRIVPLTSLPGVVWNPAFSPDGKQIAFFWDGDIPTKGDLYVQLVAGGDPLRLTHTHTGFVCCADWSPDGRVIAFGRCDDTGGGIFVVPALGGAERKLTEVTCPFGNAGYPKWTADGNSLVLADRCSPNSPRALMIYSLRTGEKRCLTTPPFASFGDTEPALSNQGTVAFIRMRTGGFGDVYTVALSGGRPTELTHDNKPICCLMWSANGQYVFFGLDLGGVRRVWRVPAAGGPAVPDTVYPGLGTLSRDGHRWAYLANVEGSGLGSVSDSINVEVSGLSSIWSAKLARAGGKVISQSRIIASARANSGGQLSPDDQQLAFESMRSGNPEIWKSNADGSNPLQLTFGKDESWAGTPRWSPDGKWIAFDYRPGSYSQICLMDSEGRNQHVIVSGNYENNVPSWSRNGTALYFSSNRTGQWEIWKRTMANGREAQVTHHGGSAAFESYDARDLYYSKFDTGGLWEMPIEGGEEQRIATAPHLGYWGYFAVTEAGIYLLDSEAEPGPTIMYFDLKTHRIKPVLTLKQDPLPWTASLAATRDGKTLFFAQGESRSSITMIEFSH
jgi:Tol biopolymer transport system component/DNA-binding winged helix-turn-helix (wHTH) protein